MTNWYCRTTGTGGGPGTALVVQYILKVQDAEVKNQGGKHTQGKVGTEQYTQETKEKGLEVRQ